MKKLLLLLLAVSMVTVLTVGGAMATPISGTNSNRPFAIGGATGVSPNLTVQQMLDNTWGTGVISATNDQSGQAVWQTTSNPPANIAPQLRFEFAGSSGANDLQEFGFWTGYDTGGPITTHAIFNGSANPYAVANIQWDASGTAGNISSSDSGVNTGVFTGINANWFGFYYQFSTGPMLYSYDALNPIEATQPNGRVSMLAYNAPGTSDWELFFDGDPGLLEGAQSYDFNDLVVKVESVKGVPEPGIMLLLGTCLVGLAGLGRKTLIKKS